MNLHLPSALFAVGLVGLVVLTTSQASPPPATLNPAAVRIEYMPHPRDYVQVREGAPYTVPAGKIFVATSLGWVSFAFTNAELRVNGQTEARVWVVTPGSPSLSAISEVRTQIPLAEGLTVPAGSIIEPVGGDARAWGYLADQ